MVSLDRSVSQLATFATTVNGVVGVALGGSRAAGVADRHSDWDLGVYYVDALDHERFSAFGEVHAPGAWGRIMNGGAWLAHDGVRVDVLFRDVTTVEHWTAEAAGGRYDVDGLLGYLAGIPTYVLAAELAGNRVLHGSLPSPIAFPEPLAAAGVQRWRFHAQFTLEQARSRARRSDVAGTLGHLGRAAVEAAHAVMCGRGEWVINEKGLVDRAGLGAVHERLAAVSTSSRSLVACVDDIAAVLHV